MQSTVPLSLYIGMHCTAPYIVWSRRNSLQTIPFARNIVEKFGNTESLIWCTCKSCELRRSNWIPMQIMVFSVAFCVCVWWNIIIDTKSLQWKWWSDKTIKLFIFPYLPRARRSDKQWNVYTYACVMWNKVTQHHARLLNVGRSYLYCMAQLVGSITQIKILITY